MIAAIFGTIVPFGSFLSLPHNRYRVGLDWRRRDGVRRGALQRRALKVKYAALQSNITEKELAR
jgi:hypothetical protein